MLNKQNRIGNRKVIENLFKRGKLYKDSFLVFKYEEADNTPSQFAVSVSKKIYKSAVKRNRLKRQIYAAIRGNMDKLTKDIVALIIARPPSEKASFQELSHSVEAFINKVSPDAK